MISQLFHMQFHINFTSKADNLQNKVGLTMILTDEAHNDTYSSPMH